VGYRRAQPVIGANANEQAFGGVGQECCIQEPLERQHLQRDHNWIVHAPSRVDVDCVWSSGQSRAGRGSNPQESGLALFSAIASDEVNTCLAKDGQGECQFFKETDSGPASVGVRGKASPSPMLMTRT